MLWISVLELDPLPSAAKPGWTLRSQSVEEKMVMSGPGLTHLQWFAKLGSATPLEVKRLGLAWLMVVRSSMRPIEVRVGPLWRSLARKIIGEISQRIQNFRRLTGFQISIH